jgi:hypothetical protein
MVAVPSPTGVTIPSELTRTMAGESERKLAARVPSMVRPFSLRITSKRCCDVRPRRTKDPGAIVSEPDIVSAAA